MMHLKKVSRSLLLGLMIVATGLVFMTSPGASQVPEKPLKGVKITAGMATWTSALPPSAIFETLLERLGATVETKSFGSNALAYKAIALGDVKYWPNGWFPMHKVQLPEGFFDKATLFDPWGKNYGIQGYLIDTKSIQKYGVTSLLDFKGNKKLQKAFDDNGDGKADLFGCPPGWGCHERIEDHLDLYGLRDAINHVTAAYPANFAAALSRIKAGKPTLYYTWSPNDTVLTLVPGRRVKWINSADKRENLKKARADKALPLDALIADLGDKAATQPALLGWPAASIQVAANNKFLAAHPAAKELFKQVVLPKKWVNEATKRIKEGEDSHEEVMAMAQEWISEHQWLVDKWLRLARQAAAKSS